MKQISIVIVALISLLFFVTYVENRDTKAYNDNTVCVTKETRNDTVPASADNFIVGKFNGTDIDTLECLLCGQNANGGADMFDWLIRSKRGTCKDMRLIGDLEPMLNFEGDLDDNGTDEFGFLTSFPSNWEKYQVFTYKDGDWQWLYEPQTLFELDYIDLANQRVDIVERSQEKGYVRVYFSESDEGDCHTSAKLVKINISPINNDNR